VNQPSEITLAVTGAVLLGGSIAWRVTTRRSARSAIGKALASDSPPSRIAALQIVAAEGIGPWAGVLRRQIKTETDPEVRRVLAQVIAQSQWEPAGDESLVKLRLWAHRQVKQNDVGRPALSASWWELADHTTEPAVVIVTGAGGPAGVAALRWLRAAGHRVIAVDADPDAVGLRLGDGAAVVKRYDDPGYAESLAIAARAAGATVLVPTVAEELLALGVARDELTAVGLRMWLPDPDAVTNCIDKWRFAKVAQASKVHTPSTNLGSADGVPGPWIVKPRFGRGSRDIFVADDDASLAYALARVPEPLVQTRLVGREFTADALVGPDGSIAGICPRWRLETRGGISTRGETFLEPAVVVGVAELLGALGLSGPANVQGFFGEDGVARFTEVNPRLSGGLPLSLAAGADFVGEYVRVIQGLPLRRDRCSFRLGTKMFRYFEDVFEG
jgi:carbamoyl-phosphate synthase large subunit